MQVLIPSHGNTLKILGKPKKANRDYRTMIYVMKTEVEDGILLFHVLTRELLLLTHEEYNKMYELPELYEKWFIVPTELDDMKYADQVRFIRKTVQKAPQQITGYTIFPTTDCNARCFYCYEMGRSRIPMKVETAHKAAEYIVNHCGGEKVRLLWFGGEPLFNKSVISIICSDLQKSGVDYTSAMISNGYLFDENTIREAVDLWKLKWVQITLDGTEEVYNKSKAYIYRNSESPYRRVLANIKRLLEEEVVISVRMNMDKHNSEDLLLLVDELHDRFLNQKNFSAYSHVLFEYSGHTESVREETERKMLYEKQRILDEKLIKYGMKKRNGIIRQLPMNMCMADSDKSRTILPNGEVGLCEHYSEEFFIGNIYDDGLDLDMIKSFKETWDIEPACKTCACYPECIRLKKCSEQKRCFAEMMDQKKRTIVDSMLYSFEMWKKKEAEPEEIHSEIC